VKRREFIALLGGAAVAKPLVAHAQQSERMRRTGVLIGIADGSLGQIYLVAALLNALEKSGWTDEP
jgi:putative tryptophan/tyrosine transport system substrate-binding protein